MKGRSAIRSRHFQISSHQMKGIHRTLSPGAGLQEVCETRSFLQYSYVYVYCTCTVIRVGLFPFWKYKISVVRRYESVCVLFQVSVTCSPRNLLAKAKVHMYVVQCTRRATFRSSDSTLLSYFRTTYNLYVYTTRT